MTIIISTVRSFFLFNPILRILEASGFNDIEGLRAINVTLTKLIRSPPPEWIMNAAVYAVQYRGFDLPPYTIDRTNTIYNSRNYKKILTKLLILCTRVIMDMLAHFNVPTTCVATSRTNRDDHTDFEDFITQLCYSKNLLQTKDNSLQRSIREIYDQDPQEYIAYIFEQAQATRDLGITYAGLCLEIEDLLRPSETLTMRTGR